MRERPADEGLRPASTRARRRTLLLVAVVAFVAAAAGIPGGATLQRQVTGDEPHYLMTAISLAEDADLDVADEYADERHRSFDAPRLTPQAEPRDGRLVEPHDPLLPALLALPVALGGWVGAKLTLAVLAGVLAAVTAQLMLRGFGIRPVTAGVTTGLFAASAPLAVYGHQIYPELPAACAVAIGIWALVTVGEHRTGLAAALLGSAVTALPWLSVKYVPLAAVLALAGMGRWWRRGSRAPAAILAAVMLAAGGLYVLLHLRWYGGLTAYAAGSFFAEHGGEFAVVGTEPNYLGRTTRLVGLLVDRHFGLAAWQPAWLLAVPAVAALARRRPPGGHLLLWVAGVGWLGAALVAATMHGWWFPGRHVVAVLPALVVAVAWWAERGGPRRLAAVTLAGALGVVTYVVLLVDVWQERAGWVVGFAATSNPWYRAWQALLPDYTQLGAGTWWRHALWVAAVGALATWGLRAGRRRSRQV